METLRYPTANQKEDELLDVFPEHISQVILHLDEETNIPNRLQEELKQIAERAEEIANRLQI